MFERFTEKAIKTIVLAQEEARRIGHNFVGSEMILLGVIRLNTKVSDVLSEFGLTLDFVRAAVEKIHGRGADEFEVEMPFTDSAKQVLQFAYDEAIARRHTYSLGAEHLVLGILKLDEKEPARQIFVDRSVDCSALADAVASLIKDIPPHQEIPAFPPRPGAENSYYPSSDDSHKSDEKGIKVVHLAQEESRRLGHNFVGTEAILLGLIRSGGRLAGILEDLGLDIHSARTEAQKITGRGSGFVEVEIPFTPRAKRVLELSWDEARQLGHNFIGREHLMLGLLREGEGVANRILELKNVNTTKLRKAVIDLFDD